MIDNKAKTTHIRGSVSTNERTYLNLANIQIDTPYDFDMPSRFKTGL